jgi:hypothetical protein
MIDMSRAGGISLKHHVCRKSNGVAEENLMEMLKWQRLWVRIKIRGF